MRLLDTAGPSAVTLRAVGDAAGISQSAPYRHFEDKRALLRAMARANLEYFNTAAEKAERDAQTPFGLLAHLVQAYFDFARRYPVRYRFLADIGREDSALGAEVRRTFGAVASVVQAAQLAGQIRIGDAEQVSALIFGAAYGMADFSRFGLMTNTSEEASSRGPAPDLAPLLLNLLADSGCREA